MKTFFNNMRVAVKLPVIMVALSLMALIGTTAISYLDARAIISQQAEQQLQQHAQTRVLNLTMSIEHTAKELSTQSKNPIVIEAFDRFREAWDILPSAARDYLPNAYRASEGGAAIARDSANDGTQYDRIHSTFHPYMRRIAQQQGLTDIYLVDALGRTVYSLRKATDFAKDRAAGDQLSPAMSDVLDTPVEQAAAGVDSVIVLRDYSAFAADSMMQVAVSDPRGRYLGRLVFQVSGDVLGQQLVAGEEGPESFLLTSDGGVSSFARNPLLDSDLLPEALTTAAASRDLDVQHFIWGDGSDRIVSFAAMSLFGQTWFLVSEVDTQSMFAPAQALLQDNLLNILISAFIIAGLGLILARSVSGPLVQVGKIIEKVADSQFDVDVPAQDRKDEIGGIARNLEALRTRLKKAKAGEIESHYKSGAFNATSASMMIMDADMVITYLNPSASALMHEHVDAFRKVVPDFNPDQITGRPMQAFHADTSHAMSRVLDPANLPINVDIAIGTTRFALIVNAVCNESGALVGFVAEWSDVTEERMRSAIMSALEAHQATATFNPMGTLIDANAHMLKALGWDRMRPNITVETFFEKARAPEIWANMQNGETVVDRLVLSSTFAENCFIEGSITPVMDRSGKVINYILMGTDVSEAQAHLDAAEKERQRMIVEQRIVVDALSIGLGQLSDGDLVSKIEQVFPEEHEKLREDFNLAVTQLNEAMIGVIENADAIRGEAREIANAADDLSGRTEKQAGTLEETAAALDELTASVRSAAEGASRANAVVADARSNAIDSGHVVTEAVAAMGQIDQSSSKISKIIGVIDDIAFQTNLLALNAGVEAARAGEAGRGFAVVASEVRALAQRSSEAAKEINTLISTSGIQVKRGVELVDKAGRALEQIVESVSGIADHVSEIAMSAEQQSVGLAEINSAVNQLDQVTQQNAAMFEETTAASHALTREAQNLAEMISRFKTTALSSQEASSWEETPPKVISDLSSQASVVPIQEGSAALAQEPSLENDWDDF